MLFLRSTHRHGRTAALVQALADSQAETHKAREALRYANERQAEAQGILQAVVQAIDTAPASTVVPPADLVGPYSQNRELMVRSPLATWLPAQAAMDNARRYLERTR